MKTKLSKEQAEEQLDYMIEKRFPDYEKKLEDESYMADDCVMCEMAEEFCHEEIFTTEDKCDFCILKECSDGYDAQEYIEGFFRDKCHEEMKDTLKWWCHQLRDKINETLREVGSEYRVDLNYEDW